MLEAAEQGSQTDSVSAQSERTGASGGAGAAEEGGRAASWASSFERLLEDPAGLHTFAVSRLAARRLGWVGRGLCLLSRAVDGSK